MQSNFVALMNVVTTMLKPPTAEHHTCDVACKERNDADNVKYVAAGSNCDISTMTDCSVNQSAAAVAVQLTLSVGGSCPSTADEHTTTPTTPGYR